MAFHEGRFANADSAGGGGGGGVHPKSVFTQGRLCSDENRNDSMLCSLILTRNLVSCSAMTRFPADDQRADTSRVPSTVSADESSCCLASIR